MGFAAAAPGRLRSAVVATKRMGKDAFYKALSGLDEDALKKVLWVLYWRGTNQVRERIEAEIQPADAPAPASHGEAVDPQVVLREITDFVSLAREGAYMAGNRRVSPKERSRWRFTFQRLATDARRALALDVPTGAAALERLIDLARETKDYDLFHSEDPMEAANFVVSDAVAALWRALRDHHGFTGFARLAAVQLIRWEQEYVNASMRTARRQCQHEDCPAGFARFFAAPAAGWWLVQRCAAPPGLRRAAAWLDRSLPVPD